MTLLMRNPSGIILAIKSFRKEKYMLKLFFYLATLAIINISWSATPERDAINIIIKNQKFLLDKLESDKFLQKDPENMNKIKNDTMLFCIKNIRNLQNGKDDSNFIEKYYWCRFYMSKIIAQQNDTITIYFFSNLLRSKSKFGEDAFNFLLENTSYGILQSFSGYIKKNLELSTSKNLSERRNQLRLLCLLNPNENEKKMIVASQQLSFFEKAGADEKLLDSLIYVFKNDTSGRKGIYEYHLLRTGKKRAIKAIFEDLATSRQYEVLKNANGPCTTSHGFHLLEALRRYFPQEPILGKDFPPPLDNKNYEENLQKTQEYWLRVRAWVLKNFDVKMQDSLPYSHYFEDCREGPFINRARPPAPAIKKRPPPAYKSVNPVGIVE
jgi:hypothetical protein